ncbi:MAG: division/cell wall cluster transcriptional repressor MraZ [Dehalococcoidia bacterium]|nr:division/cell wall cluster transcriptional repressor MraZ [Dehalococcoidia bacterium]
MVPPFTGSVEYQLDDRNRVAVPPRYRDHFDAPAMMTTGKETCIAVYTQAGFEEASERVEAIPPDTSEGRKARRFFYGNAFPVGKDAQGRFLIPKELVEYAGLKKDVMVVGLGKYFEIWDAAAWRANEAEEAEVA